MDTPNLNPCYMPRGHGGAEEGPEFESSSSSPTILSFLASLEDKGIEVPSSILSSLGKGVGDSSLGHSSNVAQRPQGVGDVSGAAGAASTQGEAVRPQGTVAACSAALPQGGVKPQGASGVVGISGVAASLQQDGFRRVQCMLRLRLLGLVGLHRRGRDLIQVRVRPLMWGSV